MPPLTKSPAWQNLITYHARIKDVYLRTLFGNDPGRAERFSVKGEACSSPILNLPQRDRLPFRRGFG